jgi:hypothetical protein
MNVYHIVQLHIVLRNPISFLAGVFPRNQMAVVANHDKEKEATVTVLSTLTEIQRRPSTYTGLLEDSVVVLVFELNEAAL